ncbi:PAS-domain containing protein [Sagittula sp. SSi028]|uniref:PAS-domain containing protein n=1 Tax=Sagittula sp. SSi028 TaxID=3400636 RepID=UPI003AF5458D
MAIGAVLGLALLGILYLLVTTRQRRDLRVDPRQRAPSETILLMRDGHVIDHTPDVAHLFNRRDVHDLTWAELRASLLTGFPDMPEAMPTTSTRWASPVVENAVLRADAKGASLRISLETPSTTPAEIYRAITAEQTLDQFHTISELAPDPAWQTSDDNTLLWCNHAYSRLMPPGAEVDSPPVFDLPEPVMRARQINRVSLETANSPAKWFEVTSFPTPGGWMHFASSIDGLVNAEMAQRNFVQTLTKTFAHLPIGLAVFDKSRQLVLFNPALVDLTHLPVDFLSSKPNLLSFFDHMRENRMMPEPKNYANWRDKLYDVVSAAREDRYAETWNLSSGLTYKITGRPHPDGAVAFLLEDISAEISLTRRFRSELELSQSVLDCLDDAVVVFSRLGVLTFCNAAYRDLWNAAPDNSFAEVNIVDATRDWSDACTPSPIWADIREFVLTLRERATWDAELTLHTGQHITCTVEPVAAGATMVRFARRRHASDACRDTGAAASGAP